MHASLVVVWLGTALVSALEHKGLSARLLADAGILDTHWQALLVWSGLLADLAVGLALCCAPGRSSYLAALALMLAMTVTASVLQPALWLHPLGPLLKNLPIAAMLLHRCRPTPRRRSSHECLSVAQVRAYRVQRADGGHGLGSAFSPTAAAMSPPRPSSAGWWCAPTGGSPRPA